MKKKVSFTTKPGAGAGVRSPDQWVSERTNATAPTAPPIPTATKRLTIDVSIDLHRRMKVQCAARDEVMADVVRELLERHFPPRYEESGEAMPQSIEHGSD